jgi:hypothetical protein
VWALGFEKVVEKLLELGWVKPLELAMGILLEAG